MTFTSRVYDKELLDQDDIPFADIRRNMEELETINRLLGGHRITVAGMRKFAAGNDPLHVCEIGCGGGDNLRAIQRWCQNKGIPVRFTGIDIKDTCISYAKQNVTNAEVNWICSDYRDVHFDNKPDIIFSSLFCHHFTDEELTEMVKWKYNNSKKGFFINDLHRHPLAYYSIKLLTQWFSSSYLVKNDAPLSVRRGFRGADWQKIFAAAGVPHERSWMWAFRWLITVKK